MLTGWDILDYAAHLTLTTLALHEHRYAFTHSRIATLPAGVISGQVHLGSLDRLNPQLPFTGKGFSGQAEGKDLGATRVIEIPDELYDVVLMNPPFSRSAKPNVKFGYSSDQVKKRMQKELKKLGESLGAKGIGTAGLAAHFMILAERLLKENGRMGVVLPRSCLSGASWSAVRERILRRCHIEYIVSNYDPGDQSAGIEPWNWSENTDLGEVLLVARKTKPKKDDPVTYVNLWHKPANDVESLLLSQQILGLQEKPPGRLPDGAWDQVRRGPEAVGVCYTVPQGALEVNFLLPCVFAYPELNLLAYDLVCRPQFETVRLKQLVARVGPDIAQVKQHFKKSSVRTGQAIVWGHQGAMNTLALDKAFVGFGARRKGRKSADFYATHAASLLVAERPHLHTECLLATQAPTPVLTTAFWELEPRRKVFGPLLLLWLQSTFGFVVFLSHATSSMGDIFKMKKAQLAQVPVPKPTQVDLRQCQALLRDLRKEPFERHPAEFARAARGEGPRRAIDDFFISQLGMDLNLRPYYELLASDPVVTTKRI